MSRHVRNLENGVFGAVLALGPHGVAAALVLIGAVTVVFMALYAGWTFLKDNMYEVAHFTVYAAGVLLVALVYKIVKLATDRFLRGRWRVGVPLALSAGPMLAFLLLVPEPPHYALNGLLYVLTGFDISRSVSGFLFSFQR